MGSLTGAE